MYLMFAAALLPAIILGLYVWRKDPQPEPLRWIARAFFAGIIICFPVAYLESFVSGLLFHGGEPTTLFGTTAEAFFVAALPEEAAKLFILWLFVLRKNPYFDEHFDGIVYAVFVSLGFAAIENVFYVVGSGDGWVSVAATRALLAVPGHYAFGILMGYYYTKYHFFDHSRKVAVKVLLVPVLAHGVYDAIAMSGQVDPIAGALSTIVLVWFCIKLQKYAKRKINELAAA
jgi:RsiW-degrading membrane proteinase PrsW (M82 family)